VLRKIRKKAFVDVENNYVCNLSISPGEILNLREDFRSSVKRNRGENANNVGKVMNLISVFISFAHIMFYIVEKRQPQ
jgi:hypothetical protein